jgi:hypothetical protein
VSRVSITSRSSFRFGATFLTIIALFAHCDASTALAPATVNDVVLTWEGDTLLVIGSRHSATIGVTVDGNSHPAPRFRFTSSDPEVISVSADGQTFQARRIGTATLTAQLLDAALPTPAPSLATLLVVSPGMLRMLPSADTIRSLGDTLRLSAEAVDADDIAITGVTVTWSTSDAAIATVSNAGLVTSHANGEVEITAALGAATVKKALVVRQRAAAVRFNSPAVQLDALGADTTIEGLIVDARGMPLGSLAPALVWSATNPAVATVASGVVTAVGNGTAWVRAAADAIRDSLPVYVMQRATRVVIETPSPVSITSVGETSVLRARAYDRRDNELINATPTWRSLHPLVVHVESQTGIATAIATGSATLVAELDAVGDSAVVEVSNAPAQLILSPSQTTITSVGDTLQLTWSVRNSRGVDIPGVAVFFGSSDTAIVRATSSGQVIALGTGTARVIAATEVGIADTSMITVINAVAHVEIFPDLATMASVGDTVIPAVSFRNARSVELARSAATWTSDDVGVARVTAGGVVIATGAGEVMVRATSPHFPDLRDSMAVVVTNAPASVVIERDTDLMTAVGMSRSYSVEVRNARNALIAVVAEWRTLDAAVASVSTTGLVTSKGVGTARIVASAGAVADTLLLTVRDDVASVVVNPATATLTSLGDVLYPAATARNELGYVVTNPPLSWVSADTTVARLQSDGGVLAVGTGNTRIIVSSGTLADTLELAVQNLAVFIDIAGLVDTVHAIGDSIILAVVARNARGDDLSTASLTWSVEDPVVARVSSAGVVTARAVGATWVRATGGSARDSIWIVVTNDPASLTMHLAASGVAAVLDTMTATGQSLTYATAVFNGVGLPITDATVTWSSTDATVIQVSPTGTATAVGFGSALVIARAGIAADTVQLVVANPSRIYVNNAVVSQVRFGTLARPFATIQDGVNFAGVDDTVIVFRGNSYSEAVTLGRRITLLGDSAAFVSGGRDPLLLPLLRHDLGSAGITTSTPGASYTMRYLGIQHSVDGEAIASRDADNLVIEWVYVNPIAGFRTGRGILVERAMGTVLIARSRVDSVYAFGIRAVETADARIDGVTVRSVAARSTFNGSGIEVLDGTGIVTGATVRGTAGPQVAFLRTASASLTNSSLAGEQQLVRLDSVRGSTTISGNTFDLRRQPGEAAPARGGGAPDPSGLEILRSAGVLVSGNVFVDIGGHASLMDGVRLEDVRVGLTGAGYGARLTANRFGGPRMAIRSARSSWESTGTRVDSASIGVNLTNADTVTVASDTIMNARLLAVQSTGTAASLSITQAVVTGAQRALHVSAADRVTLRHSTFTGVALTGLVEPGIGAIDISAGTTEVVGNTITNFRRWSALALRSGAARADSNFISRNLIGIRLGSASIPSLAANSIFDNDTLPNASDRAAVGLRNDGVPRVLGDNWWGAPEGPQSDMPLSPVARGDSITGDVTSGVLAAPIAAHRSAVAFAAQRRIAGNNQTGTVGIALPVLLTVRAVDAAGLPRAGVNVTFRVNRNQGDFTGGARAGNDNTVTLVTDTNGLAGAEYIPLASGTTSVSAVAGTTITFTVNVP